eukprot:SAG11_NODE_33371_length_277_cov_2.297753_1_plen_55_part_10
MARLDALHVCTAHTLKTVAALLSIAAIAARALSIAVLRALLGPVLGAALLPHAAP